MADDWISLREFSRRRGVTLQAVQRAITSGRVSAAAVRRDARNRLHAIEWHQATREWNTHTDPDLALRTGTVVPAPTQDTTQRAAHTGRVDDAPAVPVVAGAESSQPRAQSNVEPEIAPPGGDTEFHRHRTEKARLDVEKQRTDLAERMGALARVEEMRATAHEVGRLVHNKLMELPERLSPLLAVETDPLRVHALLASEIRGVLNALADRARALGA